MHSVPAAWLDLENGQSCDCALIVQGCEQHGEGDGEQQKAQLREFPAAGDCCGLLNLESRKTAAVQVVAMISGLVVWWCTLIIRCRFGARASKD